MTLTEIEPEASTAPVPALRAREAMAPAVYQRLPRNILADGASSGDHKVIGRLWILGSLLFGLFALVADLLVRFERTDITSSPQLFTNEFAYEQWFTLHRASLVFLFVVPLLIGIAMTVVPLQLGSPSVAFPRAAAAALWTWAVAGVIMVVSWAIDGGLVDRGTPTISKASQLSILGLGFVVLALMTASMVLFTTVFTERSQGMSLYNVPMFSWSMLVATGVWLLTFPVLISNLVVMWFDARGDIAHSFGRQELYQQINWVFDQPQVFAFAIPVLGMIAEALPVALGRRLKSYDAAMVGIGLFGALSFGAYAQTFFNPNANQNWLYVVGSVALLIPVLLVLRSLGQTAAAAGRAPTMSAHLMMSIMALVALLGAGALATIRVLDSLFAPVVGFANRVVGFLQEVFTWGDSDGNGWQWLDDLQDGLRDTFDDVGAVADEGQAFASTSVAGAMLQLALVAGLLAGIAGLFYWAPKIVGRRLSTGMASLAGLLLLGGALISAIPDAISGFLEQPEFAAGDFGPRDGVEAMNFVSMIGSAAVLGGLLLVLITVASGFFGDDPDVEDPDIDERDPWGGHTLEWLSASPPPVGNFEGPYVVTSEAPLLDDDFVNPYTEGASA